MPKQYISNKSNYNGKTITAINFVSILKNKNFMRVHQHLFAIVFFLCFSLSLAAQTGEVRGYLFDSESGQPIMFGTVTLIEINKGTTSDAEGFFNLSKVPVGSHTLYCSYLGYDSTVVNIKVENNGIVNQTIYMNEKAIKLDVVEITGDKIESQTEVKISEIQLTTKEIKSLPGVGGDADLAQYLQVLPGVVFTGDQGGQLYIRGGSPSQNKILLDGMTIYNPFHSIGFYSVFETEIIRTVDVLTGGFNAEYGGRTSAVVNIVSRDGDKSRYGGLISASPFQSKVLLEGPIKKLDKLTGRASSFILTAKRSYIDKTSPMLYSYASEDSTGLPYNFTDVYGKVSFTGKNGARLNLFGFNFNDNVNYSSIANINWRSSGVGANFKIVPSSSKMIIGGHFAYSDYLATFQEGGERPKTSGINGFEAGIDFTFYGDGSEIKYGFEVNGSQTNLEFVNPYNITVAEEQNNTELAGFVRFRKVLDKIVIEPSLRVQYYASLSDGTLEPRLGIKYNFTDNFRFKFASGLYSQNLISTVNERDIVNLFVGFLSSPDQVLLLDTDDRSEHNLQKAIHAVAGFEIDLNKNLKVNIEPYIKKFTQLINLNRNKTERSDANYRTETGAARGLDFLVNYQNRDLFVWVAYSIGKVTRFDGVQDYSTSFDRRHNVNFLTSYEFGYDKSWQASVRWNLGSGFPFTLTQGFNQAFDFEDGISTDYVGGNGDLNIIYSEDRNTGRLPYYHRLDASVKKTIKFTKYSSLDITASVTNAYNRENIFYFDRVEFKRVNQLPILPSLGAVVTF